MKKIQWRLVVESSYDRRAHTKRDLAHAEKDAVWYQERPGSYTVWIESRTVELIETPWTQQVQSGL